MKEAQYNEESKKYELLFESSDSDVIQTEAKAYIQCYVRINENDWCKAGSIAPGDQITAIAVTSGLNVKLVSTKAFSYEMKDGSDPKPIPTVTPNPVILEVGRGGTEMCTTENWTLPEAFNESSRALVKIQGTDINIDLELTYNDDDLIQVYSKDIPSDYQDELMLKQDDMSTGNNKFYYYVYGCATKTRSITLLSFEHNGEVLYQKEA